MIDEEDLRARLTPEQYRITRRSGTERPFTGPYWNEKTTGLYTCVCCDAALFRSETKYDSGSGWPSYWAPVAAEAVTEHRDSTLGMARIEIRCAACEAHLGHVFPDGPRPTGLRYCVNGNSLLLHPDGSDSE